MIVDSVLGDDLAGDLSNGSSPAKRKGGQLFALIQELKLGGTW